LFLLSACAVVGHHPDTSMDPLVVRQVSATALFPLFVVMMGYRVMLGAQAVRATIRMLLHGLWSHRVSSGEAHTVQL
jgi:hypothetical protein